MTDGRRRLFFALWPPAQVRDDLGAIAADVVTSGRKVAPEALHLTLIFLGRRGPAECARALAVPDDLALPGFTLELDRLGHFPRTRILWLGPARTPPVLMALFRGLNERLSAAGVNAERRNGDPGRFRPHVTLARKALPPEWVTGVRVGSPARPSIWPVDGFALVESRPDRGVSNYEIVKNWRLN